MTLFESPAEAEGGCDELSSLPGLSLEPGPSGVPDPKRKEERL